MKIPGGQGGAGKGKERLCRLGACKHRIPVPLEWVLLLKKRSASRTDSLRHMMPSSTAKLTA